MNKRKMGINFALKLFVIMILLSSLCTGVLSNEKYVRDSFLTMQNTHYVGGTGENNFSSIQEAINNSTDGDFIFVYNGTYFENLIIDKSIRLVGESMSRTIINGGNSGDIPCIKIISDYVSVNNFSIVWADWEFHEPGFEIYSDHNIIKNNNISIHDKGIILYPSSTNCTIDNNLFSNNHECIMFSLSYGSNNHCVKNNYFYNNDCAVKLISSKNNVLKNNIFDKNVYASILLSDASDNKIIENTITNSSRGILSDKNSKNNIIYNNNFYDNINNAIDTGENIWNCSFCLKGNYWDDYSGIDEGEDGIGDVPYYISHGNKDCFPLIQRIDWETDSISSSIIAPQKGFINEKIQFYGNVVGGIPPYEWKWIFPNDRLIINKEPRYTFKESGTYNVSLIVKDYCGRTNSTTHKIHVFEIDKHPPRIVFVSPQNGVYKDDVILISQFPFPVVFGRITIKVNAFDEETSVVLLTLTINDITVKSIQNDHLIYTLPESYNKGFYSLYVEATDLAGNTSMDEITIIKI